jgi:hypothetical protein
VNGRHGELRCLPGLELLAARIVPLDLDAHDVMSRGNGVFVHRARVFRDKASLRREHDAVVQGDHERIDARVVTIGFY